MSRERFCNINRILRTIGADIQQKMKNIVFGIHSIEEAIESDQDIDKLFIQKGMDNPAIHKLVEQARKNKIALSFVPVQKIEKLAQGNHQGAVAKISPIKTRSLEETVENAFNRFSSPLFLLLDEVTDVRNFGAIIRTAESSGAHAIIIPKYGSAAINEQTVKTSAGAIFHIPICKVDHLKDAMYYLKSYDTQLVAATEKGNQSVYHCDFTQPTGIVMGSEGKGVTQSIAKMCDVRAKLPMLGKTESLNVSVACALFLYEAVRQKMDKGSTGGRN